VDEAEVDKVNAALGQAQASQQRGTGGNDINGLASALSLIPGTGDLLQEAQQLQRDSEAQAAANERMAGGARDVGGYAPYQNEYGGARANDPSSFGQHGGSQNFQAPPGAPGGPPAPTQATIPGVNVNIDPQQAIAKIYPLLAFRDKVVRNIAGFVEKIPGLEKAIETISEKVTLFVMGLMAPFVKPIIAAASNALKTGSGTVVSASQRQQYIVWEDPTSSDPTHSLLSKDHFSNILNQPAGEVASVILQYVAPRVIYGWDHPEVPEQEILNDVGRVFHHPAIRDQNCEAHRLMFNVVEKWAHSRRGPDLNEILSSQSVKAGKNHHVQNFQASLQPLEHELQNLGSNSHSATAGGPLAMFAQSRSISSEGQGSTYGGASGYDGGSQPQEYEQSGGYGSVYQQSSYEQSYGQTQQSHHEGYGQGYQEQEQGYGGGYRSNESYGQDYEQGSGSYGRY
jgi:hypothetical protein